MAVVSYKKVLPSPQTRRWVMRKKMQVVDAVAKGILTVEVAEKLYRLSPDEFRNWVKLAEKHGMKGLRITRCQQYRREAA